MRDFFIKNSISVSKSEWDWLISTSEESSFFILSEFLQADPRNKGNYFVLAYSSSGELIGGIVGIVRSGKSVLGKFMKVLWVESGPIVKCEDMNQRLEIKIALLEGLKKIAQKERVVYIDVTHWSREKNKEAYVLSGFSPSIFASFLIDLTQNETDIFSNFRKGTKSSIKKAMRLNVKIKRFNYSNYETAIDEFYQIYHNTGKRSIKKNKNSSMVIKSKEFIKYLLSNSNFGNQLFIAYYQNKIVAGAIIVRVGKKIVYYLGASDINLNRVCGGSNLLQWEVIKWAKSQGHKIYDLGGVPWEPEKNDPAYGVYIFKKGFGGIYHQYYGGSYIVSNTRYKLLKFFLKNRRHLYFIGKLL